MTFFLKVVCFLALSASLSSCSLPQQQVERSLPTMAQVGAEHMPVVIEPVYSPYFKADFQRPLFPERTLVITNGNAALQKSLDSLGNAGGGRLIIKKGYYTTGRLTLQSNTELHLEEGATVEFKSEIKDFLPVVFTRSEGIELYSLGACIYANGATNIAITGKGKFLGPGAGDIRRRTMTHEVIEKVVLSAVPVNDRIYDGKTADYIFPPALIAPIHCKNVLIEGISLSRSSFWNIVPTYCENVIIRGVKIDSKGIQRGDGIDIESSQKVLIEYCSLETGDDCIALKAGRGYDGMRVNRPTKQVVVRNCLTKAGHGGLTIGSETAGGVQEIYVHDCIFAGTDVGIRFKTRRPRGGGGHDFLFSNIRMDVNFSALRWDMLGQAQHVGQEADRSFAVTVNALTPQFSKIKMDRIAIERAMDCINIEGIPESPLAEVELARIEAKGTRFLTVKDAKNILIRDSHFTCTDTRVDSIAVQGLQLKNVSISSRQLL